MKRTYQPKKLHRKKEHGFRKRMKTKNGRKVLARRRAKGRKMYFCGLFCLSEQKRSKGVIMLYTEIIKDNRDFLSTYRRGRYSASRYSVIYVRPNGRPYNRLGITAGKSVGNAVCRNRAKRLIRLAYREAEVSIPVGMDIVIVARSLLSEVRSQEYCEYMRKKGIPDINKMFCSFDAGKKRV